MNILLISGLLAVAFFLFTSGMEFFGLLTVVLAGMLLFVGRESMSGAGNTTITEPFGPQGPIVVENKMPDIPEKIEFKLKQNWHEYQLFEYHLFNWGFAWHNLGHWLYNLATGHKTKPMDKGGGGH